MEAIQIKSTNGDLTIKIDKSKIDLDVILEFLDRLRVEFLAQKIDFDKEILKISDEIKENWWSRNKERFVAEVK
ncbi:MAG: hypothetical protein ONB11_04690 [candidate division KSB1 bacterium]|nr:hypothetical protein [candidate division KSB1 bacterium]MDZ7358975.1 hypothetical protein [candidate division KSB1 bacterium]MDZ7401603.1 hypothetical protein [candidate division KSB1 bacterium]